MLDLRDFRVAIVATDGFEESELTEPIRVLRESGAEVDVLSNHEGRIQGYRHDKKGRSVQVDRTLGDVSPEEYDGLVLPGGALNADSLRMEPAVQAFVRSFAGASKPMAAICHGPWALVSADVVRGRTMTSYRTIQDDLKNAGAEWVDRAVVQDGNLVTSREADDLPAFNRTMVELFASRVGKPVEAG